MNPEATVLAVEPPVVNTTVPLPEFVTYRIGWAGEAGGRARPSRAARARADTAGTVRRMGGPPVPGGRAGRRQTPSLARPTALGQGRPAGPAPSRAPVRPKRLVCPMRLW